MNVKVTCTTAPHQSIRCVSTPMVHMFVNVNKDTKVSVIYVKVLHKCHTMIWVCCEKVDYLQMWMSAYIITAPTLVSIQWDLTIVSVNFGTLLGLMERLVRVSCANFTHWKYHVSGFTNAVSARNAAGIAVVLLILLSLLFVLLGACFKYTSSHWQQIKKVGADSAAVLFRDLYSLQVCGK